MRAQRRIFETKPEIKINFNQIVSEADTFQLVDENANDYLAIAKLAWFRRVLLS